MIVRYARASETALEVVWEGFLPRTLAPAYFRPSVDLSETATELRVIVEIAGLADDAYRIAVDRGVLVISGERPWEAPAGCARIHLSEIRYGRFQLEVPLPAHVRVTAAKASYDRGLLHVDLEKGA